MQRRFALSTLLVVGTFVAGATGVAVVAASSEYGMSVSGTIETPTQTVTIEDEYEIDEIGVIEQGETLEIDVTSPDPYYIIMYNSDEEREYRDDSEASTFVRGTSNDDLDTSILDPGTYMLSLEPDDAGRQAVTPLVVQGYDISLEYPSTVEADSDVTFDATVVPTAADKQPEELELVLWEDGASTEVTLEQIDGTSYSATRSISGLESGTYDVYGAVIGDDTVQGYETVMAVTDGHVLTVTEPDVDEEKTGESGNDTDDGSGNETVDDGENGSAENTTETDGDGIYETNGNEQAGADDESDTDENETSSDEDVTDDSDPEPNVIEPNEGNETNETGGPADDEPVTDDEVGQPTAILSFIAAAVLFVALIVRNNE